MTIRVACADSIEEAAQRLAAGGVVALPTETVYGLGADAASESGIAAIYGIKGRPPNHPLIVHVLDAMQAAWWGELGEAGARLAQAFWPGPLTLIVRRRAGAPAFACGGESTVGLRSPSHPVARALLEAHARLGGHGIAAPSANRFGRVSPTSARHVADDLGDEAGLILDGGPCEVGVESTIVDLSRGAAVLLRPGAITVEQLEAALGGPVRARDAAAPRASGTLAAHYAPHTPVELVDGACLARRAAEVLGGDGRVGEGRGAALGAGMPRIGVWSRERPALGGGTSVLWEPAPADPDEYARALYDTLRRLDRAELSRLLIEQVPAGSEWDAVRDRLGRAAATFSAH